MGYKASNGMGIWSSKETALAYLKILPLYSHGEAEEDHKTASQDIR
jgi:hypothetical protein